MFDSHVDLPENNVVSDADDEIIDAELPSAAIEESKVVVSERVESHRYHPTHTTHTTRPAHEAPAAEIVDDTQVGIHDNDVTNPGRPEVTVDPQHEDDWMIANIDDIDDDDVEIISVNPEGASMAQVAPADEIKIVDIQPVYDFNDHASQNWSDMPTDYVDQDPHTDDAFGSMTDDYDISSSNDDFMADDIII